MAAEIARTDRLPFMTIESRTKMSYSGWNAVAPKENEKPMEEEKSEK